MTSLLLRSATLTDGSVVDIALDGERIGAITPAGTGQGPPSGAAVDLAGYLVLPAPAEPHAHLDKALTADRIPNPSGDLLGAIEAWRAHWHRLDTADIADRAERAARLALASGVTAIRSHVDCSTGAGMKAVEGVVEARQRLAGLVEVQIVVLVAAPTSGPDRRAHLALLEAALDAGADVVGGCPHVEPEPAAATANLLAVAERRGYPVDLHTDETLDPGVLHLVTLAAETGRRQLGGTVTASHCVSLGMQPPDVQARLADQAAEAGVAVVALPQTNLFLQARDVPTGPPRGLAPLAALLRAGVTMAAGADNVQDPFNLMGRSDPMETAALLVMAGHLDPTVAYALVSDGARAAMGLEPVSVAAGSRAELLAVRAPNLRAAIAEAPADRLVFHRGRLVARTCTSVELGVQ